MKPFRPLGAGFRARSLEARLRIGLAIGLVSLIGVGWWLAHTTWQRTAEGFVLARLEHDAEALLGALIWRADGRPRVGTRHLTPIYHQPYSGHYFVIETDEGQRLRSRSLWDQDLPSRPLAPGESAAWRQPGPTGQLLLIRGEGYRLAGRTLTLTMAEDIVPLQRDLASLRRLFALAALGGLVLMLFVQRRILRWTFGSLDRLYRDIERLESGRIQTLTEEVPTEILPLVRRFNLLLQRFAWRLERSRNVAGNLGHALKGPLSLLLQQLRNPELPLAPSDREALLDAVERLRRLAERQLKRARLAGAGQGGPGLRFEPAAELPTLIRLLDRIHAARRLDIRLDLDPRLGPSLDADREDMLELFGNLLDNACKWARARVRCSLHGTPDAWTLRVEDDGPGCPDHELAAIAGRGIRLDEEIEGHGLGLAIVREIVEGHGGQLVLGRSEALGGFRAEVRFPAGAGDPENPSNGLPTG